MGRAFSPTQVQSIKHSVIPFTGKWERAFGNPESRGTWLVWGNSGNGKSSFVMQMAKELCKYGKVVYNSLEEGIGLSFKNSLTRHKMEEVNGNFFVLNGETMEDLSARLSKRKSPDIVIIDSLQYTGMNFKQYQDFTKAHPTKLFIFTCHACGDNPEGRVANRIAFDAGLKILVKGYRAICKGRDIPKDAKNFTIWEEGESRYWMDK